MTKLQRSIALGFCSLYAALLSFKSDFAIAKERGLFPNDLEISQWAKWKDLWKKPSRHQYIGISTDDFTTANYALGGSTPSTCLLGLDII